MNPEELDNDIKLNFPLTDPYFHTRLIKQAYIKISDPRDVCEEASEGYTSTASTTINGTPFLKRAWAGAAAGNRYEGVDYTTVYNGKCQLVQLYTHSTASEGLYTDNQQQIQEVDALHATDMTAIMKLFDQVMSTIMFNN